MDFISWEATSETLHDALHRIMVLVLVALISLFIFKRLPTSEVEVEKETEIEAEVIEPKYEQEDLSEAADEVDGSVENTQEKMEVFITSEENVHSTAEIVIIEDEMQKELRKCTCAVPLRMHRLGGGKYKISNSNRTCLVRILRSTVMVRVGGGWDPLDNFLSKYDPCRVRLTNLGNKLPAGSPFTQHMVQFSAKQTVP